MIRAKLAEIFNTHIDDKESISAVFERMDAQGRLDIKKIQLILAYVLEQLDKKT